MPVLPITDLDDPRLEPFRNLKATNATRYGGHLIAEGDKLVWRLLHHGLRIRKLLLTERFLAEFQAAVPTATPLLVVSEAAIEQIVGFNFHRGVLAEADRPVPADLAAICSADRPLTVVACPEVHDPQNLGSILRLCGAFGVDAVALGPDCCDPFSRRVLRVSMGVALGLPIAQARDLAGVLAAIRQDHGLAVWATVTGREAAPLGTVKRPRKLALVLGSEGHGLPKSWRDFADLQVTIPMRPGVDSLNVAVAAGIFLHHLAS